MKAVKAKEIIVTTENKVGQLEEVLSIIKDNGINIRSISAWAFEERAFFRLTTSDNLKAREILGSRWEIEEKDVVIVDLPDEVGQLDIFASKLKENNIDLNYIYGTTSDPDKPAIIIFSSNNDDKAMEVLSAVQIISAD